MKLRTIGKISMVAVVPAILACVLNGYPITASLLFLGIGMSHVVFNFRTLVDEHFAVNHPRVPPPRPHLEYQINGATQEPVVLLWQHKEQRKNTNYTEEGHIVSQEHVVKSECKVTSDAAVNLRLA